MTLDQADRIIQHIDLERLKVVMDTAFDSFSDREREEVFPNINKATNTPDP